MAKSAITLDAIDRRILRALQRDGRLPVVALAEHVGLSPTPCQRRVRRLEEEGVITRYAAVLDPPRLGLPLQAFVMVALESHAEELVERFHKALAARPEVLAAYAMSGEMDLMLLDVGLPTMDGFEVLRELRACTARRGPTPLHRGRHVGASRKRGALVAISAQLPTFSAA